jgi:hypothetical protein
MTFVDTEKKTSRRFVMAVWDGDGRKEAQSQPAGGAGQFARGHKLWYAVVSDPDFALQFAP